MQLSVVFSASEAALRCFGHRRHLLPAAWMSLELLDTARAVVEFDVPMRVLGLWWGEP
jgi:hypothetical protein